MVITLRTMVRPWMVALLMLLTDHRRSFGIGHGPAAQAAEVAPAPTSDEDVDVDDATSVNATEIASVGCNYKGRSYDPGSLVNTDQPCLKCTCVTGNLVCHLQVCPELPDPPPQGCVIVHKMNKCCAHLQCYYEQFDVVHSKLFSLQNRSGPARMDNSAIVTFDGFPKGCVINGTIYAEGSAMDSSSLCEYCYCIKGHQQCVRPQCSLTIPGCTAVYKKHTCCPIRYKCAPSQNATEATTTEMASSLSARLKDCRINGRLISLGEPVIGVARSSCETCFCINGQVRCDKVICPPIRAQISPNCGPVYSEGHCCPTSYNCTSSSSSTTMSSNESRISPTVTPSTTTTSIGAVATTQPFTVTTDDIILLSSSSTSLPQPTPTGTQMTVETDSASSITVNSKNTTDQITEEPIESRHANPASLMHDDFGGLNVTEKSNNFEMDYDDPTLPPSLPNLKIIPFVAADAVVDEPAAAYENYQPVVERVYNVSDVEEPPLAVVNSFSPPIETEGGFIPKDSPKGAIYLPDKFRKTTEQPTVHHDEPVVEHQPIGSVWCISSGKKYKHGELLTDPSACDICICFNAKIVCQENCPAVKVGCQRINDPNNSTCCGRIVCSEYENEITTEHTKKIEVTTETTKTTANIRDAVIEHILYSAPPTNKPVVTSSPTTLKPMNVSYETSSLKPTTSTVKLVVTLAPTTEKSVISSTSATIKRTEVTTPVLKPLEDEDYSFESMFSFLFNGDTPEQSSSPSSLPSSTNNIESETRIEHRTDDEIDEKVNLDDVKHGQTDFMTPPKQQHEPNLNPADTEQPEDPKYHQDTNPYFGINQHSEDKHNKVESQEVYKPLEFKPNTETKQHVNDKLNSETEHLVDTKTPQSGIKQHVDVKSHNEIKSNATTSSDKQQSEVKTHFNVKENAKVTSTFDLKHHDEAKPSYHDFSNHQTEVKSQFSVRDQPELKTHLNSKLQSDATIYTDFKHKSEINTHFDVKDQAEVNPYFDFKQQTEVKQHSDFKHHADVGLQPEVMQHTNVKPNVGITPLKTKVDTEFKLLASMLKISGCNIYGRMYRVGKIISELSNPCLECMCTEIGVHCNQLKC